MEKRRKPSLKFFLLSFVVLGFPFLGLHAQSVSIPIEVTATVVINGPDPLEAWRTQNFIEADLNAPQLEASIWGNDADPDNDGLSNLIEYSFGSNPNDGSNLIGGVALEIIEDNGNQHLLLRIRRRLDDNSLRYEPEFSNDVMAWDSGAGVVEQFGQVNVLDNLFVEIPYKDLTPVSPGRFARVRVER